MTCREALDFLLNYLSGDLPAAMRDAFDAHLAECPSCVAYIKSYEASIRIARGACRHQEVCPDVMPASLVQAIVAARKKA